MRFKSKNIDFENDFPMKGCWQHRAKNMHHCHSKMHGCKGNCTARSFCGPSCRDLGPGFSPSCGRSHIPGPPFGWFRHPRPGLSPPPPAFGRFRYRGNFGCHHLHARNCCHSHPSCLPFGFDDPPKHYGSDHHPCHHGHNRDGQFPPFPPPPPHGPPCDHPDHHKHDRDGPPPPPPHGPPCQHPGQHEQDFDGPPGPFHPLHVPPCHRFRHLNGPPFHHFHFHSKFNTMDSDFQEAIHHSLQDKEKEGNRGEDEFNDLAYPCGTDHELISPPFHHRRPHPPQHMMFYPPRRYFDVHCRGSSCLHSHFDDSTHPVDMNPDIQEAIHRSLESGIGNNEEVNNDGNEEEEGAHENNQQ